jgi:hypothetical protein
VADVPLVPQGGVLERGHQMPAHHARQAAHSLGKDWVAFVRHCRAPLLLLAERLKRLADLAAL